MRPGSGWLGGLDTGGAKAVRSIGENDMRIGIIGAGHIGGTLARLLAGAGHEVVVSNASGPERLRPLLDELDGRGQAGTPAEAAAAGEVVLLAIPFGRYRELPAEELAGKVVVDATNYYERRDGPRPGGAATSSELIQQQLPGATVVKAFNTIFWQHLRDRGRPAGDPARLAVPLAGDDDEAKRTVASLIDQLGFDTVDTGKLADGGAALEPGTAPFGASLTADELRRSLHG
jgi:predicted dinucleotide-binding enzyme